MSVVWANVLFIIAMAAFAGVVGAVLTLTWERIRTRRERG